MVVWPARTLFQPSVRTSHPLLHGALRDGRGRGTIQNERANRLVQNQKLVNAHASLALGDVLDGTAAEPHDRGMAALTALALPLVLLGAAVRAPLIADGPPPAIGSRPSSPVAVFAVQALLAATSAVPNGASAAFRAK